MTKLNSSDVVPLVGLLFVFFLFGVLTGIYFATHYPEKCNTEKEQSYQCNCSCDCERGVS